MSRKKNCGWALCLINSWLLREFQCASLNLGSKNMNSVWNSSLLLKIVQTSRIHWKRKESAFKHCDAGWSLRQTGRDKVFSQCSQVFFGVDYRDWYLQNVPRKRQKMKADLSRSQGSLDLKYYKQKDGHWWSLARDKCF